MKAISLWQPWATLIAKGIKHYETRSWYASYRGPLAIHAAKRRANKWELDPVLRRTLVELGIEDLTTLPYGCIVCTANLVACYPTATVIERPEFKAHANEIHFGDYTPGRWAWQLEDIEIVDNIPARGSQGFWEWPDSAAGGNLPLFEQ